MELGTHKSCIKQAHGHITLGKIALLKAAAAAAAADERGLRWTW